MGATCADWSVPGSAISRPRRTSTAAPCWPYRATNAETRVQPDPEAASYIAQVREAFLGPADERLATDWQAKGISLETVRHAILLGCVRKPMSLIDRPATRPVRQLRYFEPLLWEVQREHFPAAYWQHLQFNLGRCEDYWQHNPEVGPGCVGPEMEPAGRATAVAASTQSPVAKNGHTR